MLGRQLAGSLLGLFSSHPPVHCAPPPPMEDESQKRLHSLSSVSPALSRRSEQPEQQLAHPHNVYISLSIADPLINITRSHQYLSPNFQQFHWLRCYQEQKRCQMFWCIKYIHTMFLQKNSLAHFINFVCAYASHVRLINQSLSQPTRE